MERIACTKRLEGMSIQKERRNLILFASFLFMTLFSLPSLSPAAESDNSTVPGEVKVLFPTITNLAVEWVIEGDKNLNGVVTVDYRMAGESEWHKAMPLVRVPADNTGDRTWPTYRWDNKHSGSIIDLKPDTEYEIRLRLSDQDGGTAEKIVRSRTRPVPKPASGAVTRKVNADNFADSILTAMPGDIFLLAPGYYEDFVMQRDGEPGRPIVIRSDRSHPVINSTFDKVDLQFRKQVILEGVTVNGSVNLRFAEDVAVRRCQVNAKYGIIAKESPGCKNCYIADNVVTYIMPWVAEGMGSSMIYGGAANVGEGIEITGPGNVICYNRVKGYRDCVSTMEDLWVYDQTCIDIYNNDIYVGADDGIEADFCFSNCRIMRNRITNCGMGLSSQPGLGGPNYFIRNVMYNLAGAPFKLERHSVGNIFLHNTCVKCGDGFIAPHYQNEYFFTVFKNNLTVGGLYWDSRNRPGRNIGRAVFLPGFNSTCQFDYNGVGSYETPFSGLIADKKFTDLATLRLLTSGKHSVQVDLNVFENKVVVPCPVVPEWETPDLRIREGSAAVDAGLYLPNLNDGYTGKAPDLGAYELGQPMPHYGPRPEGMDEETEWLRQNKK